MGYLDRYKNRLTRNGDNFGEVYANNTISFIESTFASSPTFRVLEIVSSEFPDIKQMDARVVGVDVMGTLRQLLFRPHEGLNIGCYIKFDNYTWLLYDQWGDRTKNKYTAYVERCNRMLKWRDSNGNVQQIDCIASQSPIGSKASRGKEDIQTNVFDVNLPVGQLYVYVEKNALTDNITINQRFIFGKNAYEVHGIDDISFVDQDKHGIMQIIVKICTKLDEDDFVNDIAFNKYENPITVDTTGADPTSGIPTDTNNGGKIW